MRVGTEPLVFDQLHSGRRWLAAAAGVRILAIAATALAVVAIDPAAAQTSGNDPASGPQQPKSAPNSEPSWLPPEPKANATPEEILGLPKQVLPKPQRRVIRIAAWNLQASEKAPVASPKPQPVAKPQQWRNTFGSERNTQRWRQRGAAGFEADIVLLQGVANIREARRLFGARTHQLIISRQVLDHRGSAADGPGFTAVAIRYRAGFRLTQNRDFLPSGAAQADTTAAPLAVRLWISGNLAWFVSVHLDAGCFKSGAPDGPACKAQIDLVADLRSWISAERAAGIPIVIGGSLPEDAIKALGGKANDPAPVIATSNAGACSVLPAALAAIAPRQPQNPGQQAVALRLADPSAPKARACVLTGAVTIGN